MTRPMILTRENGTFLSFYDYGMDNEKDDFEEFVQFVIEKLGVFESWTVDTGLDDITEFEFRGEVMTLGWEYGCYLRIPPDSKITPEEIIELCYGTNDA